MGSPSMNLFPAKVALENGRAVAEVALDGGGTARAALRARTRHGGARRARRSSSASAPRRSPTATAPTATAAPIHIIEAPVEVTEPAGSDTFVVTHIGGKDVTGRFRADVEVRAGEPFPFAINMEKAVAFDPKTEMRIS